MSVSLSDLKSTILKAKTSTKKNFKQSVDLIIHLRDIDLKKPGTKINEIVELPNPVRKEVKVCVIGSGQMASEAKKSGADAILQREDLEGLGREKKAARKLAGEFDFFISEAALMPTVGKTLGVFLGPRGKMPVPVPPNTNLEPLVKRYKKSIRLKIKDQPQIQCRVGTEDMSENEIAENVQAILKILETRLEKGVRNIKAVYIKTTMGEAVPVSLGEKSK